MRTYHNPETAIKITKEDAIAFGINPELDQQRGELKTFGVWNIPKSFKALCLSSIFDKSKGYYVTLQTTVYGQRTLTNVRQGGYELEGYVSIRGKKYTAFTSSQLFEIEGKLIDVAIIHVRIK